MRLVETSVFTIVLIFFLLDQRNFIFLCWGEKKEIGKYLILTLLFTTFLYLNMSLAKHSCGVTVFLTGFYFTDKFAFGFFFLGWPHRVIVLWRGRIQEVLWRTSVITT